MNDVLLSIVVPAHNEAQGLDLFFGRVIPILETITRDWEIICIDDGSRDDTLNVLLHYRQADTRVKVLRLSRNFGKEAALSAGLFHASGKAVIPIDADLQDPPELIPAMMEKWQEGYKVVLATRRSRPGDSWLKRKSAHWFYRLINRVATIPIPENTGDFRLMDAMVIDHIRRFPERTRFMKGLFAWVGFSTCVLTFDREERAAGNTTWNYWKLWKFALDGIFSFTTMPLHVWSYIGGFVSASAFAYGSYLIGRTIFLGTDVPGYASLMVVVLFLGGIQLLSLGIIGEYVGRIYRETKQRPLFIVEQKWGFQDTHH
ncbi:MAG: glycosyltransferase family 2 protein [Alphaproteobacteria bacterium]|nr:glycosyltransferase family 2 protein [Alphaproteobacteria bacterium]